MRTWGDDRTIRAEVIREIMRGRLAPASDPRGLRLRGAKIAGRLDLVRIHSDVALQLYHCYLDKGVDARHAHVPSLVLAGCRLAHPSQPPLDASGLSTAQLALDDATVMIPGAQIAGDLDCAGATLSNRSGPALVADGLQVDGDVLLREGFEATGSDVHGTVRLSDARIAGKLACDDARICSTAGPALEADKVQVDQGVFLVNGLNATGAGEYGTIRLSSARIGGQLQCVGATLLNKSGPAIDADGLQVDQNIVLAEGFSAVGNGEDGAVRMLVGQPHFA
jgi:hypothetical protein